jgi:cytochrome c-type biogenesis protein CcsB
VIDADLARASDALFAAAIFGYAPAALGLAAETAFGRVRTPALATAGVGGRGGSVDVGSVDVAAGESRSGPRRAGDVAIGLTVVGWALHLASIMTRGLSAHRIPWGNMYEFASAATFCAVTAYLVLVLRGESRAIGGFVLAPVVLAMGLAGTVLYTSPGPVQAVLDSYWLSIHVTAAVVSAGVFTVGSVSAGLYLMSLRADARVAAGKAPGFAGIARRLPAAEALDRLAHRMIVFGFPIWTFAVIAGAIWAEAAWGRYWGWDPKETWAFITWVGYACYLHARSTAGWRGRPAAWIALAAYGAMLFNLFGVNIWISGLHSYADA